MPMVLGKRLPANVAKHIVTRVRQHLTPYGLATEALSSPHYQEGGYWRGPIWAPSTMLVVTGLLEIGEPDLARTIMEAFCNLCRAQGFAENFSPKTGEGHYCPAYTWTSSVFMIFQELLMR
jgi:glycogen debranching enzyme